MKYLLAIVVTLGAIYVGFTFGPHADQVFTAKSRSNIGYVDKDKAAAIGYFSAMKVQTCFRSERLHEPDHVWEKKWIAKSGTYMLLMKDSNGVLVAQPNDHCEATTKTCLPSIRSVEYHGTFWLALYHPNAKVVKCPPHLNIERLHNIIRTKYEDRFKAELFN